MGAEASGLCQEAACMVPRVLSHDLHQLPQKQGDLHVHQGRAQGQLGGGGSRSEGDHLYPVPEPSSLTAAPAVGVPVSLRKENPAASPWGPLDPVPQPPCAGPPRNPRPCPHASGPRSPLRLSQAGKLSPCGPGWGASAKRVYPSLPWCWEAGREKTSPRWLPPGPASGGAETARRASS